MEFVSTPEEADIILFGAPVDQGTENAGCSEAPSKIRAAFDNFFFSETKNTNRILDRSDIVEEDSFEETMKKLYNKTVEYLKFNKPFICIGGNHSISLPLVRALSKYHKKIGVIHLDAHPDCQKNYFPYGDIIGEVSKLPEVKKIISIGLRNWSKDEYDFLLENKEKISFLTASRLEELNNEEVISIITEALKDCSAIYITVDIDFIDPVFAPGTGWLEPGGFSSRRTIDLLHKMSSLKNIKGMDITEINPKVDIKDMTSILGAKLIFEFADSLNTKS